jgi:hypothetical protein
MENKQEDETAFGAWLARPEVVSERTWSDFTQLVLSKDRLSSFRG